ncbi:MAG: GNAT family N-acetyltransferase, partial [Asgard group archaeon]|nr:GNAT family N-acetyltransferase [Asgard group archaeon]
VRFNGFPQPSIVIPFNTNQLIFSQIMKFLQKTISGNFSLVTYDISETMISRFFTVEGYSLEYCMIIDKNDIPSELDSPLLKKVTKKDSRLIDLFYKSINAYPWNLIQLESGFYFYIERNNQIVACGGTHFENKKSAQLGNIFVLEEYRGKQYGKLITTAITREILSKKDFASLFVFQDNIPALYLYKKLGYRIYKSVNIFFCKN